MFEFNGLLDGIEKLRAENERLRAENEELKNKLFNVSGSIEIKNPTKDDIERTFNSFIGSDNL
ncbi:MAG: hypothetical protein ABF608_07095 [Sporolactobacillus sp.]